jgi:hypothetical protein
MKRACLRRPKAMASSVAVSQACSAVTTSICAGSSFASAASAGADVQEGHALEAQALRQRARALHQLGPRLDAVDVPLPSGLEEQVVQDEAQVGLARAMVGQRRMARPPPALPAAASR